MNVRARTTLRSGALAGALAVGSMATPALAMDVRIEYGGQAHSESELQDLVLAAVSREVLGTIPAGWSHVVVFRAQGDGADLPLQGDGATLGPVPAGAYVVVAVPAGEHRFQVGNAGLPLRIAPGQAYFLRVSDGNGTGQARLQRTSVMAFDQATRRTAGI
jgi:hypothetical protein